MYSPVGYSGNGGEGRDYQLRSYPLSGSGVQIQCVLVCRGRSTQATAGCALTGYRMTTREMESIVDAAHIHQFHDFRSKDPPNRNLILRSGSPGMRGALSFRDKVGSYEYSRGKDLARYLWIDPAEIAFVERDDAIHFLLDRRIKDQCIIGRAAGNPFFGKMSGNSVCTRRQSLS